MYPYCFFNTSIISIVEAQVKLNDLGVLRGYGIFDFLRTYHLRPLLLQSYLDRFYASATAMHLDLPFDITGIEAIIDELLEQNAPEEDVGIRLILTGGPATDAMTIISPTFYILIEELHEPPQQYFEQGAALVTQEYLRPLPEIKTTYYLNAVRQWKDFKQNNIIDVLYFWDGQLLETSRSNFFIFKENTLITADENILKGRIRKVVLQLAEMEFEIKLKAPNLNDINDADEAFITGTTKKVMPVTRIDDQIINEGVPGKNTKKLMSMFREYIENHK